MRMEVEAGANFDVPKELRSLFDPLIHSDDKNRLQNIQLFLSDIEPYLSSKEQRTYIVKRLIAGISTTRSKAATSFAIAFHALVDSEMGSKIKNERILEIMAQEFDLQKILKVGIKTSLEEQCQFNALLTVIGILVSLRKFLCLEIFAKIHSFVLKNRSVLSLKLSYAYDCVLNSVLSEVAKSDYKELLFGNLLEVFSSIEKGEAPLDICLELLAICRRFPKLLMSLKVEAESWTILDVISEERLLVEVKSYFPFNHPVLKLFPLVYAFDSDAFQKLWQCLVNGEQSKLDQVLFYNLLGIICSQDDFSEVHKLFPLPVLKMIDAIPGDKKLLSSFALIQEVLQNLKNDILFDVLSHFVANVTIVSKFLVHKGWFANLLSKLEEKHQIKVAKLLEKQMKVDIWSFEAGLSVINSALKREPNPVSQNCIAKLLTLLVKTAVLQPSDEKLVLKDDSKLQIFNLLKKQLITEKINSHSLTDLYLDICEKNIETAKNRKVVEKSCKYLRKESARVKKLITILAIDLSLNDTKPSYQNLEQSFATYLKSFKSSDEKFEQIFIFSFAVLSFAKASYAQIVSSEIRNFVASIEFNKNVLEAMVRTYENAEKLNCSKQEEIEANEEVDNEESVSDSQSDLSDSDEDDDLKSAIQIPKDMIPEEEDDIVIDLDDDIDEEQAKALEEFDRKLEQVIGLKSSKTASDFVETEPAVCFFDLLMPILRAKSTSTDVIRKCVTACFKKALASDCSKSFRIRIFELFELQYWSKANSLADLVVEFESETLQEVAKFIFDCLFVDKTVLTNQMWKNAVKFVVCFVMESHESVKLNLSTSICNFLIGFLVKGKYPTVGQFMSILATLQNDAFWSFTIKAFNESDRSEAKDLTNLLNSTLVLLSPDIMSKLPKSPEVGEFMVDLCRKLLQESVKSSCQPSIRKKYFQFVSNVALRNERAGSSTKLKSRVGKTLVAFETLEKDSASLNLLRNLSTVFKVDEETLASVSYLFPMEKDDRKKGKKKKKKTNEIPTEQVVAKKVKIA